MVVYILGAVIILAPFGIMIFIFSDDFFGR